ncbi:MAG: endonuclease domain-containing protein [Balneolaceae bacterium]
MYHETSNYTLQSETKSVCQRTKKNSTKSEVFLWNYLKRKQMHGFDFHRQRPVDDFIIDFFCQELYLGIELDGYSHLLEINQVRDIRKEKRLNKFGVKLIRFWDEEIFNDLDNVLRVIEITVQERKSIFNL